jgi:hypothetical protein
LGTINRIQLAPGIRATRIRWPLEWRFTPPRLNAVALASMLRLQGIAPFPPVFTTVHQYHPGMSRVTAVCGQTLRIVADGHHPSNYPASYIETFGDGEFVVANPLSADWFLHHGRHVVPGPWFQASPKFRSCNASTLQRVMLVLNHAGDWSALIERSDTDRLVLAFVETASSYPDIEFVVRVHPTMATPEHEGVGSIERIRGLVQGTALPNLVVSDRSSHEDLERGDLYLSEYSQMLIDAWQRGRLGAAINLTRRRSFMVDYERLGFLSINSKEELVQLLRSVLNDPNMAIAIQNHAVERFNATLTRWDSRGIVGLNFVTPSGV